MNKNNLTYAVFLDGLQAIQAEGLAPSVRTIRARIGGSHSTLMEFFRRWRSETETVGKSTRASPRLFRMPSKRNLVA